MNGTIVTLHQGLRVDPLFHAESHHDRAQAVFETYSGAAFWLELKDAIYRSRFARTGVNTSLVELG